MGGSQIQGNRKWLAIRAGFSLRTGDGFLLIVRLWSERWPIAGPIGIEAPIVSMVCFWEINRKSKHQELWPKTSVRSPGRDATAPQVFPMSQRLCSNLVVAVFVRAPAASNLSDSGISALVARRHLTFIKPCRRFCLTSLPHENENSRICLQSFGRASRTAAGMNRKSKGRSTVLRLEQPRLVGEALGIIKCLPSDRAHWRSQFYPSALSLFNPNSRAL